MASGGGAAACAACKYQRRRCTPECPLAEFFPQDRSRVFRNAHRLFGVSNILKTLARAGREKRREAMHCIIYESQAWDINPATGCVPIIQDLQRRIRQAELDLRRAYAGIQAYRAAAAGAAQGGLPNSNGGDPSASSSSAPLPPPFQFQLVTGSDDGGGVAAEAYDGGGGLPFTMYGGEQQQMMMNAAAATEGENIELHMPTWMMMQPPQYEMASAATAAADMSGKVVQQLPQQQDYRFFIDAMMVPQAQHQQQPVPIKPAAELDDEMSYLVDSMDGGDTEMHHESTSMDSSDMKVVKAPKMEDVNDFK
ncbi:unnamed protein product [Urochloa decumbens]|uniref:LOB domain-containing protein n=1 Tax=Urochloa decumbens TaxID=240449 RepID=A0ABC9DT08_9POAL